MNARTREVGELLTQLGGHPIYDPHLERWLSDCFSCHAERADEQRLWRPLSVYMTWPTVTFDCAAGCSPNRVRRALENPVHPLEAERDQWRHIAEQLHAIAVEYATVLDRYRGARPALKAVA